MLYLQPLVLKTSDTTILPDLRITSVHLRGALCFQQESSKFIFFSNYSSKLNNLFLLIHDILHVYGIHTSHKLF